MPIRTSILAALFAVFATLGSLGAMAGERQKFDPAAFAAAQAAGKSILVDVSAPWCPTCKAQKPIVDELTSAPEAKDLVVFDVDFDTGRDALKLLNARSQSTLIAFKGATETGRSVGDTKRDSIATLIKGAL
jgi:thiol-disulfide isomerase/thioredoxin